MIIIIQLLLLIDDKHHTVNVNFNYLEDNEEEVLLSLLNFLKLLFLTFNAFFSRYQLIVIG